MRPEAWTIRPDASGTNTVRGRIGESIYLGEVAQYQFLAGDQALKIFELNPRLSTRPTDRDLYAAAEPDDVVVLRK